MSIVTFFLVVFIWIGIFHHLKEKASKQEEKQTISFWDTEREANTVRRKELSNLPYIQIPLDKLPFQETCVPELNELQTTVQTLANKKIVNLNGMSNTELKLTYGPANLDTLIHYDENYSLLIRTLSNWGSYLYKQGSLCDAKAVLEFGISCKTDIKNNYVLLAQIYHENQELNKISFLISQAESLDTLMKSSIISSLHEILNS